MPRIMLAVTSQPLGSMSKQLPTGLPFCSCAAGQRGMFECHFSMPAYRVQRHRFLNSVCVACVCLCIRTTPSFVPVRVCGV